ncbi:unnamed protein product [Schistocephalus solidus]|uniref:Uncharacterized protein n=1 Tax=Schistocephalus solidus TaxID=70667 RepID=A0A183SAP3_SCHSO|nr:unnamed protein product [Schistocephalus solidus]
MEHPRPPTTSAANEDGVDHTTVKPRLMRNHKGSAGVTTTRVNQAYLPLLVRDSIAVLLLRGVQPSEQSLALQTHLLSQSAEPLVPAIPVSFSFRSK